MPCNHPLHAFKTGSYSVHGREDYVIGRNCDEVYPAWMAKKNGHTVTSAADLVSLQGEPYLANPLPIPCGHCVGCRMEHAKEWKVRNCLEALAYKPEHVYFLTLTYGEASLPVTREGVPCLRKDDLQRFWKRLRKNTGKRFRYFACGEYGGLTLRPHYHAIVYGDVFDPVPDPGHHLRSQALEESWTLGLYDLQVAEPGMIAYVSGYVEKKQLDPNWDKYPVRPYITMSRRPGIGVHVLQRQERAILSTQKVYGNFGSEHSAKLPRTFMRKVEERFPGLVREWKEVSKQKALSSQVLKDHWFGRIDFDLQGFAQDSIDYEKLKKVRKAKL